MSAALLCAGCAAAIALGLAGGALPDAGPSCAFRAVTGLPCPFCGLSHSLVAIGAGRPGASLALSPLGPLAAALAVVTSWRLVAVVRRGRRLEWTRAGVVAVTAIVALSWTFQLTRGLT